MSVSERTYSADAVRRLFHEAGVSLQAAAEALALDEREIQHFIEHGAPRWLVPAVIAVAIVNGELTAIEATRLASSLTPDDEAKG
jgi:hypothetical protein